MNVVLSCFTILTPWPLPRTPRWLLLRQGAGRDGMSGIVYELLRSSARVDLLLYYAELVQDYEFVRRGPEERPGVDASSRYW